VHFLETYQNVQFVDLLIADLNGFMRVKRIDVNALEKVYQHGVNLPICIFSMNILGETIEACGLGLDAGEPDLTCFPIKNSLVPS
jgi:glutamine synthetase